MNALYVGGVGLWAPGFDGVAAWRMQRPDPRVTAPATAPAALPPALRRRATALTCMVARAALEAAQSGGLELARTPLIFGSSYGEIGVAVEMIRSFHDGEGMPSPTLFHNSVHNTPAAYLAIAAGAQGFSTALAAGTATPVAALLEASALLEDGAPDVLIACADEPRPPPFTSPHPWPPAAAAVHLTRRPTPIRLGALRRAPALAASPALGDLAGHPCAGALALADAVARQQMGALALGPFDSDCWWIDLQSGLAR